MRRLNLEYENFREKKGRIKFIKLQFLEDD